MEVRKRGLKMEKMKQKWNEKGEGKAGTATEFAEFYPSGVHLK